MNRFCFRLILFSGWQLTLIVLATFPVLILSGAILQYITFALGSESDAAYGKAGEIADEALSNIRTVNAFHAQSYLLNKFKIFIQDVYRAAVRKGISFRVVYCYCA